MTTDPIEVIQKFAHGMKIVGYDVSKVYAALETVRSNYVPLELLPNNAGLQRIEYVNDETGFMCALATNIQQVDVDGMLDVTHDAAVGYGTTPNAAFLAAVKQIGDV